VGNVTPLLCEFESGQLRLVFGFEQSAKKTATVGMTASVCEIVRIIIAASRTLVVTVGANVTGQVRTDFPKGDFSLRRFREGLQGFKRVLRAKCPPCF